MGSRTHRFVTGSVLTALFAAALTLSSDQRAHASEQQILKIALALPRAQEIVIEVKKYNEQLAALTDNAVQIRVYWGGSAGDDIDVLRKMRAGQIDGAPLLTELVSQFVRQALVLQSPALFTNYKQVDAVRAELTPAFDKEAYDNGFKIMAWGDIGRLRLLSKQPISTIADFRRMRPWLYPQSEIAKQFYKLIGATGIPLGILEVYGALQTNMIDVVWTSALSAAALQWHTATHYMSQQGLGFINGAIVIRRPAWDQLPQKAKDSMSKIAEETRQKNQIEIRKSDERAYEKLQQRGIKAVPLRKLDEWQKTGRELRERMIGRVYTEALVRKAEQICARYPD
jgi:TRAP-type C4-dicarboxylate transport system substrate-binding protein